MRTVVTYDVNASGTRRYGSAEVEEVPCALVGYYGSVIRFNYGANCRLSDTFRYELGLVHEFFLLSGRYCLARDLFDPFSRH